jgi:hypothetical protein
VGRDIRPQTATDMRDPIMQARLIVLDRVNGYLPEADFKDLEDIYVVWFSYTLGNWKALVSTTNDDNRYYEVTHNKALKETYVDVYVKEANEVIGPDHPVHNV